MPTYQVRTLSGRLSRSDRQRVAAAIASVHEEATGAAQTFVQVLFDEIEPSAAYVGGRPAVEDHLFIDATIRAGRADEVTDRLVALLVEALSTAAAIPSSAIWVYIHELPPRLMVEYGRPLPLPGEESPWLRERGLNGSASRTE